MLQIDVTPCELVVPVQLLGRSLSDSLVAERILLDYNDGSYRGVEYTNFPPLYVIHLVCNYIAIITYVKIIARYFFVFVSCPFNNTALDKPKFS